MRKLTAILLTVVMLLSSLSIIAFAGEDTLNYVVLGDSIAYGSGLANPKNACYGKIVSDSNGYSYANHSVPGHTTRNLIARLNTEAVIADVGNADIISISIGGNDFLTSNLMGLMYDFSVKNDCSKYDEIADSFYENLTLIIDMINELNPDAIILMQTLYNPQFGYFRPAYQAGADRINAAIAKYAENYPDEIIIVDVGTALGDDENNFADDNIHPSAQGNEIIAYEVLSTLVDIGVAQSANPVITEQGIDIQLSGSFSFMFDLMGFFFRMLSALRNLLSMVF